MTEKRKAQKKKARAKWYQNNKEHHIQKVKEWSEANPNYIQPSSVNLGYWVVYLIYNYNGLNDNYAGQTQNIYKRMIQHKHLGKLNTETYEVLEKFDNVDEALGFELTLHLNGYH